MTQARLDRSVLVRGLLGGAITVAAGWFLSTLPIGSWPMTHGPLAHLRTHTWVLGLAIAVAIAGLLLLGWAWWDLVRKPERVRLISCLWLLPFLAAPPLFSEDAYIYAGEGWLARHGVSPYLHGIDAVSGPIANVANHQWRQTPSPYGPIHLKIAEWLTYVSHDPLLLAMLNRLPAIAAWGLMMWAVPRLARRGGVDPQRAIALVMASPLMLGTGIGGEHNDVLVWALIAVALVVAVERHWTLGAVVLGLSVAVKVTGLLGVFPLALLTLAPGVRMSARLLRLALTGLIAAAVMAVISVVLGFGTDWVHGLSSAFDRPSPLNPVGWPLFWAPDGFFKVLAAVPLILGVVAALRSRAGEWRCVLVDFTWVLVAFVFLATPLRLWYLLWITPFAVSAPLRRRWIVPAIGFIGALAPVTAIPGLTR